MVQATYSAPIDALLSIGAPHGTKWADHLTQFSLTAEDIPELIRMATDSDLNWAESESLEVWAPVHAWRALGQLKAEAAIEPLIAIFNEMEDSDWFREEMPDVFALIGPTAIPGLAEFLANPNNLFYSRWMSADTLVKIGQEHPSARDECLGRLVRQLEQYSKNSPDLNGALICALIHLEGKEAVATMEAAFSAKRVDTSMAGDWLDVQRSLGLLTKLEVYDLRKHVDTEHLGTKATKLRESVMGFGQGMKASSKKKKRK
jgi:HEAT repeat protein